MARGSVEVCLYGALQRRFGAVWPFGAVSRRVAVDDGATIGGVLAACGIGVEETGHLFLNGQYSGSDRRVRPGDRVAVFGRDMALIYRQYFPKVEDNP